MNYKYLAVETQSHRLNVTLNNPPVNILTGAVMLELIDLLKTNAADRSLRAVVIRGAGKAWSAGADVSEHLPGQFEKMLDVFGELCELIRSYPVPTIAAVDGLCLGGGCEVAVMCDFVLASERAKFGQPEIKVGVLPPVACAHFPQKIGLANALEIVLTGEVYPAAEAQRLNMVHKMLPVEGFAVAVDAFVGKLTANSGSVLRVTKQATLAGHDHPAERRAREVDYLYRSELMNTKDAVEGLNAFLAKRPAEWQDE